MLVGPQVCGLPGACLVPTQCQNGRALRGSWPQHGRPRALLLSGPALTPARAPGHHDTGLARTLKTGDEEPGKQRQGPGVGRCSPWETLPFSRVLPIHASFLPSQQLGGGEMLSCGMGEGTGDHHSPEVELGPRQRNGDAWGGCLSICPLGERSSHASSHVAQSYSVLLSQMESQYDNRGPAG